MPVYDYECQSCGTFTALRPMSEAGADCDCPHCGEAARRVFLSVPHFALMETGLRTAHSTNERARHEPKSSASGHQHGPGCSCCSGKSMPSRTLHRPDGSKSFPSARPWMISH